MRLNKKMGLLTYASLVLALASPVSSTVMAANSTSTKLSTSKKVTTNNQATTKQNSIVGQSSETPIDVVTGWNVIEDDGNDGNPFRENMSNNPLYILTGFGDTINGSRTTTAKKVIPMKKGHIYNLDLIYQDGFYTNAGAQVEGYIDFNGDKKTATEYTDVYSAMTINSYKKTITPTEDMDYTITIHVSSDYFASLSFAVGHLDTSNGITDKSGMVTAKYVDEQGNKIADDEVQTGGFGDSYTTNQKDIAGYTFKETQGSPVSGTFEDAEQTVTYVYTKDTDKSSIDGSDVTKYVGDSMPADSEFKATATDKDGNKINVTIDKSKVDMSKAGDYDVVITADDGQTKTVQVHVLANQTDPSNPSSPSDPATPNKPAAPKGDNNKTVTTSKKKLPQTGEAILLEAMTSIIGLLAVSAALYFGIGERNKSNK